MSKKNDGGPAFPITEPPAGTDHLGMTLRDYFASHAPSVGNVEMWTQGESSIRIETARAYRWADAMLAERER